MRSLWWRLLSAFALLVFLVAVVNASLISIATRGQFHRFVAQSGETWARQLAPALAGYYARTGSWQGVEQLLRSPRSLETEGGGTDSGEEEQAQAAPHWGPPWRNSDGRRLWDQAGEMAVGGPPWGWMGDRMGIRLLLLDPQGVVIADSAELVDGQRLSEEVLAAGTPVYVNSRQVGALLAVTSFGDNGAAIDVATQDATADNASSATAYLRTAYRSIWLSSVIAGVLALVLGLVLFRQIVSPIQAVTAAAQQIAAGQLDQRVPVKSKDEVGQLARTFNQMADALARDRQTRRQMTADIAHELRTPLSVARANLEAMLDGVLPADDQEIASLHEEVMLLSRLVADLHLLASAEAGQLKLERASIAPHSLVHRTVEPMTVQAEALDVTLKADVAPDLPAVDADAQRIGQVLTNLVSNALRYTPAGGQVTVSAHRQTGSELDTSVLFAVKDTGQGMEPQDLPHIFDRFYRGDKSRSRASGGTGIGLAIVKQLVEAHGGRVWAESQSQQGATFFFTLPSS